MSVLFTKVMPLCDIPLSMDYANPVYFDTTGKLINQTFVSPSRDDFFTTYDTAYSESGVGYQEVNFTLGDTISTSVTLDITDDYMLNANYLHAINQITYSVATKNIPKHLYYFVRRVEYLSTNVYRYYLELDVITTFSPYLDIKQNQALYTERKHCNRWGDFVKHQGENYYRAYLRTGEKADALLSDDIDGRFEAQKFVGINEVEFYQDEKDNVDLGIDAFNPYENNLWLYVFVLKHEGWDGGTSYIDENGVNIAMPFTTYVAPLNTQGKPYAIRYKWDTSTFKKTEISKGFLYTDFVDDVNILAIRVSNINPLYKISFTKDGLTNKDYLTDFSSTYPYTNYNFVNIKDYDGTHPLIDSCYIRLHSIRYNQGILPLISNITNNIPQIKLDDLIITKSVNQDYEPKLLVSPNYKFGLKLQGSDTEYFEKLAIGQNYQITKQGAVTPESQKTFYSIDSGVYQNMFKSNIGLNFLPSYVLPMVSDVYKNFIATQGQQQIQALNMGIAKGVAGGVLGAGTMFLSPTSIGELKGFGGILGGALQIADSVTSYNAKLKDMKTAPDTMSTMGQNIIADTISDNPVEVYTIEYELLDVEKDIVFSYYYDMGYRVNRYCNLKWVSGLDTDNLIITRHLFNFVKIADNSLYSLLEAKDGVKELTLSTAQRETLNAIFSRGTKLWTLYDVKKADITTYYLSKNYENAELKGVLKEVVEGKPEIIEIKLIVNTIESCQDDLYIEGSIRGEAFRTSLIPPSNLNTYEYDYDDNFWLEAVAFTIEGSLIAYKYSVNIEGSSLFLTRLTNGKHTGLIGEVYVDDVVWHCNPEFIEFDVTLKQEGVDDL